MGHRSLLCLALLACLPTVVFAQTLDQQEQRERAEREAREREQRQAVPDVAQPIEARERVSDYTRMDMPAETLCFRLDTLRLQGEHLDRFDWVQRYLNQYAGRCVGQEGIGLIVRRASDLVLARGFVTTRIGLPEQNLAEGTLTLLLVPGVIREIRFKEEGMPASMWRSAFPSRPGDLLNLRALEQGLEQLKRVPSQDATMEIVPGEQPGQSDVVITLQRQKPWRGALTLDDAGSQATGKAQIGATVWLDNLAHANDLLTVGISHDASSDEGKGSRGFNASYSIPWGKWRYGLSGSGYEYHQTVLGATQLFETSGRSQSVEFSAERLLTRGQRYRTSAELRLGQRRAHSFIEGVELENQRRRTTSVELALLHRQYWGPAQIDLRLAHRRGLPWLGGQDDVPNQSDDAPTFRYGVTTFDAALAMSFKMGDASLHWSSALRYQTSSDPLYASEYISIGGRYTVNGFDGETSLSGRNGGYWRNSVTWPMHRQFAPYLGVDIGHIQSDHKQGVEGGALSGAYLGVRGDVAGALSWDAFAGWPLQSPSDFDTTGRVVGIRLAYSF